MVGFQRVEPLLFFGVLENQVDNGWTQIISFLGNL